MIPKAKKNLHACEYHLKNLINSRHFEELEINFAAFVISARCVTFVLQKEFKGTELFEKWYGNPDGAESALSSTKLYEMMHDELCKFFKNLRNAIEKEGVNGLNCSTTVRSLHTGRDFPDKPDGAVIAIGNQGIYYHVGKGTGKEDKLPAITNGDITTNIYIKGAPTKHLDKTIENPNLINIAKKYYEYLTGIVEEWTERVNISHKCN